MRAIELQAEITEEHELRIRLPEDVGTGPARVILLLEEPEAALQPTASRKMQDFFKRLDEKKVKERSVSEIDDALEQERNS